MVFLFFSFLPNEGNVLEPYSTSSNNLRMGRLLIQLDDDFFKFASILIKNFVPQPFKKSK
jgi:hypothetical protein